jgi:hypothetical protein
MKMTEGEQIMKKRMALIFALLLVIMLCGCNHSQTPAATEPTASQPTVETPPQQTEPAVTEPPQTEPTVPQPPNDPDGSTALDTELFVGQWKYLADSTLDTGMTFTVKEDGTLIKEGWTYTWKAETADPATGYDAAVKVKYRKLPGQPASIHQSTFTLYLTRTPENTYIITFQSDELGTSADYYRVGDYEIIQLTKENMLDYLQSGHYYTYSTTPSGYTRNIYCYTMVSFRENAGMPSFCQGVFQYQVSEVAVAFDPKPGQYAEGAVLKTYDGQPELSGGQLPKVTGRTVYSFAEAYEWKDNLGNEPGVQIIRRWELTGAEEIFGRIYIPVQKEAETT